MVGMLQRRAFTVKKLLKKQSKILERIRAGAGGKPVPHNTQIL